MSLPLWRLVEWLLRRYIADDELATGSVEALFYAGLWFLVRGWIAGQMPGYDNRMRCWRWAEYCVKKLCEVGAGGGDSVRDHPGI